MFYLLRKNTKDLLFNGHFKLYRNVWNRTPLSDKDTSYDDISSNNQMRPIAMSVVMSSKNTQNRSVAIRQNFHKQCEEALNKQINMELYAHYVYLNLSSFFEREDIALPGFAAHFEKASQDERLHARMLMTYQNHRGGRVRLWSLDEPDPKFNSLAGLDGRGRIGLFAMETSLELEKKVNASLLDLHKLASEQNDGHLASYLEDHFLNEQVEDIKKIGDYITNLKRVGPNLGEYLFDKNEFQVPKPA